SHYGLSLDRAEFDALFGTVRGTVSQALALQELFGAIPANSDLSLGTLFGVVKLAAPGGTQTLFGALPAGTDLETLFGPTLDASEFDTLFGSLRSPTAAQESALQNLFGSFRGILNGGDGDDVL